MKFSVHILLVLAAFVANSSIANERFPYVQKIPRDSLEDLLQAVEVGQNRDLWYEAMGYRLSIFPAEFTDEAISLFRENVREELRKGRIVTATPGELKLVGHVTDDSQIGTYFERGAYDPENFLEIDGKCVVSLTCGNPCTDSLDVSDRRRQVVVVPFISRDEKVIKEYIVQQCHISQSSTYYEDRSPHFTYHQPDIGFVKSWQSIGSVANGSGASVRYGSSHASSVMNVYCPPVLSQLGETQNEN